MRILIIEDEQPAAKRLAQLLREHQPGAEILEVLDSVEASVKWLNTFPSPDLAFMDIQLADGLSFDIFTQTDIRFPIIFTTAYEQYTLKAFKVNSIDYLLKPIDSEELKTALKKFERLYQQQHAFDNSAIERMLQTFLKKEYKERFLIKIGQQLKYISVKDIAYFYSEDGLVHAQDRSGRKHLLDYTLDQLEEVVNPKDFFRINRKMVIRLDAIHKIHTYFNSRLKLELKPKTALDSIVSRERVGDFKKWLDK